MRRWACKGGFRAIRLAHAETFRIGHREVNLVKWVLRLAATVAEKGETPVDAVFEPPSFLDSLKWNEKGLIPAIVQDAENGQVLMMAWMDEAALRETLATGLTHFYSRSRRAQWHKGSTSGHVQQVESVWIDCDGDAILVKARQIGGACHKGYRSCFFRRIAEQGNLVREGDIVFDPSSVYGSTRGND
jgi:phosphoribosyl-AMP cyclohydrolase